MPHHAQKGNRDDGEDPSGRDSESPVYVPLVNVPREDLRLRPEFGPVLARAGIDDVGELVSVDEVSSAGFAGMFVVLGFM